MPHQDPQRHVAPGEFPFPLLEGPEESRYLTWIRNHSNYMAVRGLLDYVRALGVLVRGVWINFLIFVPYLLMVAVAVAAYSYPDYRARFAAAILAAAAAYLIFAWRGSFAGFLRAGLRSFWRAPLLALWACAWLGFFVLPFAALVSAMLVLFFMDTGAGRGFPLTITVLVLAVAWTLLFALGTPIFRMQRYRTTVATGSDSSVKARDLYERSFGAFLLALFTVFAFESLATLSAGFHQTLASWGWPAFGAMAAISVAILSAADTLLSALGGAIRKLAIVLIGVLGALVPVVVILLTAEFLRHSPPFGDLSLIAFASAQLPLGILLALVLGWRALSWKDLGWGAAVGVFSFSLIVLLFVSQSFVDSRRDALSRSLDEVADALADYEQLDLVISALDREILTHIGRAFDGAARAVATEEDSDRAQFLAKAHPMEQALKLVTERERIAALIGNKRCPLLQGVKDRLGVENALLEGSLRDAEDPALRAGCQLRQLRRSIAITASMGHFQHDQFGFYTSPVATQARVRTFLSKAVFVVMIALLLGFSAWLTVDVNLTSIHGLYRDRLATAFLVGEDTKGDVDIEEDIDLEEMSRHEAGSIAPYHLINVALNLQGSADIGVRDRDSDFFIFSKRFIGGRRTGYCRSQSMEQVFPQMDLATAMAISAAAASPNMGRATNPALVAIMTLLNIRMGFWIPNPGRLEARLAKLEGGEVRSGGFAFEDGEQSSPGAETSVFREELGEIQGRWRNLPHGAERRLAAGDDGPVARPTVAHGLVGISYSGGGIRSATLNLGITQALHARGVFDHVDYMSTVSGGGYLGSSISALMRQRSRTASEIAGVVSIHESAGARIVRVHPPGVPGEEREYRYTKDVRIAVGEGDTVVEGQRLIAMGTLERKRRTSYGQLFGWRVRPAALLREIAGKLDETYRWVNVSDGGHIENLAAMELLRRRCRYIVIGDGEADVDHRFHGMANLIRSARIDLGIHIEIDLEPVRLGSDRLSQAHWALGSVHYPGESEPAHLLYLKASLTGDEDEVIREYRHASPDFPHESTADQSFTEGQFEAYRSLGQHIAETILAHGPSGRMSYADLGAWFASLEQQRDRRGEAVRA